MEVVRADFYILKTLVDRDTNLLSFFVFYLAYGVFLKSTSVCNDFSHHFSCMTIRLFRSTLICEGTHLKKAPRCVRVEGTHGKEAPRFVRSKRTHGKKEPDYVGLSSRSARVGAMRARHMPKSLTFSRKVYF